MSPIADLRLPIQQSEAGHLIDHGDTAQTGQSGLQEAAVAFSSAIAVSRPVHWVNQDDPIHLQPSRCSPKLKRN
jgi:hypothetical protein